MARHQQSEVFAQGGTQSAPPRVGSWGTIFRLPLRFWPRSTNPINFERLPPAADLASMELAFCEHPTEPSEYTLGLAATLFTVGYGALLLVTVAPASLEFVDPATAFALAGVSAVVVVFSRLLYMVDFSPRPLITWALVPVLLTLLLPVFAETSRRFFTGSVLAAVTFALFAWIGNAPSVFFAEYVLTHPRLTPDSRRALRPPAAVLRPNLGLLAALLAIAVLVPCVSPTLAFVAIGVLCIVTFRRTPLGAEPPRLFRDVWATYFAYGADSSGAPGVWRPAQSLSARGPRGLMLYTALFLTLAISLTLFFPWDVFRGAILHHYDSRTAPDIVAALHDHTWGWTLFVYDKLLTWKRGEPLGSLLYLWAFPIAVLFSVLFPAVILAAIYRRPLLALERLRDQIATRDLHELDEHGVVRRDARDAGPRLRTEWQWYVDRLRTSPHTAREPLGREVREADHLFLGVEPFMNFPILLDRSILSEHAYIVGESGAGKTSMGLMPLLLQLLRSHRLEDGSDSPPPPLVLIDLKGDPALFHTVREEVLARRWTEKATDGSTIERAGEFLFFTLEKGFASDRFNPFSSLDPERRTMTQLCQIILSSLDLNHGAGYGRSYYTARSRQALQLALKHVVETRGQAVTFKNLEEALSSSTAIKDPHARREAFQLLATVQALMEYPQLHTTAEIERNHPEHVIHMPRVLERRQVVYFWLPTIQESISVREVGQLALYALLSAAIDRQRVGHEVRQSYLVVDEFQSIASAGFKPILEQARQFGVGAILANQTPGDLQTPDCDLRPAVRTNTRLKLYFAISDPKDIEELIAVSGQEVMVTSSLQKDVTWKMEKVGTTTAHPDRIGCVHNVAQHAEVRHEDYSVSWSEALKPRFTVNDIAAISDHPHDCVAHVSRGSGYTQFAGLPFFVRSTWPITLQDYRRRAVAPWPTPVGPQAYATKSPEEVDRDARARADQARAQQQAALESAFAAGTSTPQPKKQPRSRKRTDAPPSTS